MFIFSNPVCYLLLQLLRLLYRFFFLSHLLLFCLYVLFYDQPSELDDVNQSAHSTHTASDNALFRYRRRTRRPVCEQPTVTHNTLLCVGSHRCLLVPTDEHKSALTVIE